MGIQTIRLAQLKIIKLSQFLKIQHIESSEILCCSVINESITNSIIEQLPNDISSLFKFIKVEDCENFISLAYKNNKERLGVDRVLNLIAASKKTENDLIVIDAGTAITVDYLDSKKRHLGGLILPSKELINKLFFIWRSNMPLQFTN